MLKPGNFIIHRLRRSAPCPKQRACFAHRTKNKRQIHILPLVKNNAIFDTKVSWCILVHRSIVLVHFVVVVHFKQLFRFIAFFLPKRAVLPLLIPLLQRYLFPYQLFVNRNHFPCIRTELYGDENAEPRHSS